MREHLCNALSYFLIANKSDNIYNWVNVFINIQNTISKDVMIDESRQRHKTR